MASFLVRIIWAVSWAQRRAFWALGAVEAGGRAPNPPPPNNSRAEGGGARSGAPRPPAGGTRGSAGITEEQFRKMGSEERNRLYTEDRETYNALAGKAN